MSTIEFTGGRLQAQAHATRAGKNRETENSSEKESKTSVSNRRTEVPHRKRKKK